jgi:3-hydroxy-3-methylglutaryl CoA synthase
MELYFPRWSVKQSELETFMGAGKGKFTIGLGQQNMAFCNDLEDINSVCMTAVAVSEINRFFFVARSEIRTHSRISWRNTTSLPRILAD